MTVFLAFIFAVISVAHIVRVAAHVEVRIAGRDIPMWPSVVAAAVMAALVALWREWTDPEPMAAQIARAGAPRPPAGAPARRARKA